MRDVGLQEGISRNPFLLPLGLVQFALYGVDVGLHRTTTKRNLWNEFLFVSFNTIRRKTNSSQSCIYL